MRMILLLMGSITLFISGCATQLERPTLEDLAMVGVMAIDAAENNMMEVTLAVPQPARDVKQTTQIYDEKVHLVHEAIIRLSAESAREISVAQMRVILFGEEYARKRGLRDAIQHLYRDPMVGDNVFVAVVEGKAGDLIKRQYPDKPFIGIFLNDLLHPRASTAFSPFTTVHDFMYDMTSEVKDPTAPIIIRDREDIRIKAIVLFEDGKMVDTITPEEAKIVQGLQNTVQIPSFLFTIEDEKESKEQTDRLLVDFVKTEFKKSFNGDMNDPVITLDLYLQGSVVEYTGVKNLEDIEVLVELESIIAKEVEIATRALVEKFVEKRIDPIGLAEPVRRKYRGEWTKELGMEAVLNAKYIIKADVEILNSGTSR